MPDKIELTSEEIDEIVSLYVSIRRIHADIGSLDEKRMSRHNKLLDLRRLEDRWEKAIEAKYHIPSGINWKVDLDTKTIDLDLEDQKEEGSEMEPSPEGEDQGANA